MHYVHIIFSFAYHSTTSCVFLPPLYLFIWRFSMGKHSYLCICIFICTDNFFLLPWLHKYVRQSASQQISLLYWRLQSTSASVTVRPPPALAKSLEEYTNSCLQLSFDKCSAHNSILPTEPSTVAIHLKPHFKWLLRLLHSFSLLFRPVYRRSLWTGLYKVQSTGWYINIAW